MADVDDASVRRMCYSKDGFSPPGCKAVKISACVQQMLPLPTLSNVSVHPKVKNVRESHLLINCQILSTNGRRKPSNT